MGSFIRPSFTKVYCLELCSVSEFPEKNSYAMPGWIPIIESMLELYESARLKYDTHGVQCHVLLIVCNQ